MQPKKKRVGRPATGAGTPIQVRIQKDALNRLDAWCEKQKDIPSRPEAIRQILDSVLKKRR
jgi:metal-responsive CopG/Arc/MetJ family transcriptional regulator